MTLRFSLRRYLWRHPAVPLGVTGLVMIYAVALSIQRIMQARQTVHANWAVTAGLGLTSSLTLIGAAWGWLYLAYRHRVRGSRLSLSLVLGLAGVYGAGLVYTHPMVMPAIGPPQPVSSAVQLAAIAFMVPLYGGLAALVAWVYPRAARYRKDPRARQTGLPHARRTDQLTAFIGPAQHGWSVTWIRVGDTPRPISAHTLTAAVEQAVAAATRRSQTHPPDAAAELQLEIYPEHHKRGPTLEISGEPGTFTATNPEHGTTVHGETHEDLLTAAHAALNPLADGFHLHWTRPITQPPPGNTSHRPPASSG